MEPVNPRLINISKVILGITAPHGRASMMSLANEDNTRPCYFIASVPISRMLVDMPVSPATSSTPLLDIGLR